MKPRRGSGALALGRGLLTAPQSEPALRYRVAASRSSSSDPKRLSRARSVETMAACVAVANNFLALEKQLLALVHACCVKVVENAQSVPL